MIETVIQIKPHHFVDIITSFGDGKRSFSPHPYGHGVHIISAALLENRDCIIKINLGADDICKPCKFNSKGICKDIIDTSFRPKAPESKQEWNLLIDKRWCDKLDIKQGNRLPAYALCQRIQTKMGDIAAIYKEIPVEKTKERQIKLEKGLQFYLNLGENIS